MNDSQIRNIYKFYAEIESLEALIENRNIEDFQRNTAELNDFMNQFETLCNSSETIMEYLLELSTKWEKNLSIWDVIKKIRDHLIDFNRNDTDVFHIWAITKYQLPEIKEMLRKVVPND